MLVFENALSQLNSLMACLISPVFLCSTRSLVNKVVDIQYVSSNCQLSNWVVTRKLGQYKMMKYLICA